MKIEDLDISEDCLKRLKRSGITQVEELVKFLQQSIGTGASVHVHWGVKCFDEIINELRLRGLLPENAQDE